MTHEHANIKEFCIDMKISLGSILAVLAILGAVVTFVFAAGAWTNGVEQALDRLSNQMTAMNNRVSDRITALECALVKKRILDSTTDQCTLAPEDGKSQ